MRGSPRQVLLPSEWPPEDQAAWQAALAGGDLLDEVGLAARWAPSTRASNAGGYGRWLRFLSDRGWLAGSIAMRTVPETIVAYINAMKSNETPLSPQTIRTLVFRLYEALRVMVPGTDWKWIRHKGVALDRSASRQADKRIRLQDSQRLYALGVSLMEQAMKDTARQPHWRAIDYRDGLLIAMLAARPVRRANLTDIRIGQQLIRVEDKWILLFEAPETKQRRPLEFVLPAALAPYLERYLETYRLIFAGANRHDYLWASTQGRPMRAHNTFTRISLRTAKAFGRSVNPHLFRDCAATSLALRDPVHVYVAAPLLGHIRLDTTYKHYIQATGVSAVRKHQKNIDDLRKILPPKRRRKCLPYHPITCPHTAGGGPGSRSGRKTRGRIKP